MWFPDLTVVDPYFILPVLMAATNLLNVEVGPEMSIRDPVLIYLSL